MDHPRIVEVVRRACAEGRRPEPSMLDDAAEIPVAYYTDRARLDLERARLFRALPIPVAHVNELSSSAVVREVDGVSLVLARGKDGVVRGFKNACRHRGVRLLREDCRAKAFVCPYHGWTYGLDGALIHVPHEAAFSSCRLEEKNLVPVRVEERHGLVWATLEPALPNVSVANVETYLGPIDEEIGSLDFAKHIVGNRVVREQRGNWKFLMEAFLEGYHIRTLHRQSVYPFFLDARNHVERAGLHLRTASARRAALEHGSPPTPDGAADARALRDLATFSYVIFPSTTLIAHPDWTSLIVVQPIATDRFVWSHTQLLGEAPETDASRAHFDRSFRLIDGQVFAEEDLLMCAEAQAGLGTGANQGFTFGRLESAAIWFHDAIRGLIEPQPTQPIASV